MIVLISRERVKDRGESLTDGRTERAYIIFFSNVVSYRSQKRRGAENLFLSARERKGEQVYARILYSIWVCFHVNSFELERGCDRGGVRRRHVRYLCVARLEQKRMFETARREHSRIGMCVRISGCWDVAANEGAVAVCQEVG